MTPRTDLRAEGHTRSGAGYHHPNFEHGRTVAILALGRLGEWVDLAEGVTIEKAGSMVHQVRKRPSAPFQPRGSFDARKQKQDDGSFLVQVRYVGQPKANSTEGGEPRV